MTFDISKYPEPEDYGEVLLRLMASPYRRSAQIIHTGERSAKQIEGDVVLLIGETIGDLDHTLFATEILGAPFNARTLSANVSDAISQFLEPLVAQGAVNLALHVGDGGIGCAAAEMALRLGKGVSFESGVCLFSRYGLGGPPDNEGFYTPYKGLLAGLFSEEANRMLVSVNADDWEDLEETVLKPNNLSVSQIGLHICSGVEVVLADDDTTMFREVRLSDLRDANESWMPRFMKG